MVNLSKIFILTFLFVFSAGVFAQSYKYHINVQNDLAMPVDVTYAGEEIAVVAPHVSLKNDELNNDGSSLQLSVNHEEYCGTEMLPFMLAMGRTEFLFRLFILDKPVKHPVCVME